MTSLRKTLISAVTLMLLAVPLLAQSGVEAPVTDVRIEEAIGRACETLKGLQKPDGSWDDYPNYPGATTSLAVQALILAGEPHDSPCIQKAVIALGKTKIEKTYAVACRAMAYALLTKHYPQLQGKLAADARWLANNQLRNGMWGYDPIPMNKSGSGDNSNTQFAVIGLRDASLAGVEVSQSVWQKLLKHYTTTQTPTGGWTYRPPDPEMMKNDPNNVVASVTVTAPSLASVMIVYDELQRTSGCPCSRGRSSGGKIDEACVEKGIKWLEGFFDGEIRGAGEMGQWRTYFYYGLQRAGQASGLKTFGRHDWYRRGASAMHGQTQSSCLMKYVPSIHDANSDFNKNRKDFVPPQLITKKEGNVEKKYVVNAGGVVDVSLAVIFLAKGNAPVYMNKLKYKGDWNRHRRDLALITQEVAKRLERPFRWQVVEVGSKAEDWRKDSPLLYMSGEDGFELTDDEKKNLVDFCARGGILFIEANCGNEEFMAKAHELAKELWPDWPVKTLPKEHPLYDCQLPIEADGLLQGVDDGIRTFVLLTDRDFSCAWQMRQLVEQKPKFDMAINLYAYATDKAPPPSRLVEIEQRREERRKALEEWKEAVRQERALARKEKRIPKSIPKPGRKTQEDLEVEVEMVKPGGKNLVTVNLLKHKGNYNLGLHYNILSMVIEEFQKKIGVTLAMGSALEANQAAPGMPDVLIIRGENAMGLTPEEKALVAGYIKTGGFIIAEAAMGRKGFDEDFRKFIAETEGLELVTLDKDDPFLTGELADGLEGIGVQECFFSRTMREEQPGIKTPVISAIMAGKKIVGYYSPLDLTYSSTGCVAYGLRGYDKNSALALLINMFLLPTKG